MITIDKGIPIPERQRGSGVLPDNEYPWHELEVGDSFLLRGDAVRQRNRAEVSFQTWKARWNIAPGDYKIVTRRVDGGLRVWRVE